MAKQFYLKLVFVFSLILLMPQVRAESSGDKSPLQLRNAMGTVLIAGLVGGVLGLSTLSFYDSPQDNIKNIFFGAGAAMMIATVMMTAEVADQPVPQASIFQFKSENGLKAFIVPSYDPLAKSGVLAMAMKF